MTDLLFSELRQRRIATGMSLTEFSTMLGYDFSTVGGWERGERTPTYRALRDWCGALGVSLTISKEQRMKVYLCGPINGCTDEECKDWREMIKSRLGEDRCINPMRNDWRGQEKEKYAEIVETDKQDIEEADVVLVNYDKPSVGTSMEVLLAFQQQKPVIVVCRADTNISPWLRYHTTRFVHSFDDAIKQLEAWA